MSNKIRIDLRIEELRDIIKNKVSFYSRGYDSFPRQSDYYDL